VLCCKADLLGIFQALLASTPCLGCPQCPSYHQHASTLCMLLLLLLLLLLQAC
jgi:hypothetical protein